MYARMYACMHARAHQYMDMSAAILDQDRLTTARLDAAFAWLGQLTLRREPEGSSLGGPVGAAAALQASGLTPPLLADVPHPRRRSAMCRLPGRRGAPVTTVAPHASKRAPPATIAPRAPKSAIGSGCATGNGCCKRWLLQGCCHRVWTWRPVTGTMAWAGCVDGYVGFSRVESRGRRREGLGRGRAGRCPKGHAHRGSNGLAAGSRASGTDNRQPDRRRAGRARNSGVSWHFRRACVQSSCSQSTCKECAMPTLRHCAKISTKTQRVSKRLRHKVRARDEAMSSLRAEVEQLQGRRNSAHEATLWRCAVPRACWRTRLVAPVECETRREIGAPGLCRRRYEAADDPP